jgi:hypothetical protein
MRARICEIIYSRPGITQLEIAQSIYGPSAYQGLVKAVCRQLLREGHVARSGKGGPQEPFTYTWTNKQAGTDQVSHGMTATEADSPGARDPFTFKRDLRCDHARSAI